MNNTGRVIQDGYCNGFAGRRYDLDGSIIEIDWHDYIIIRTKDNEPVFIAFFEINDNKYISLAHTKQYWIDEWCNDQ